MTSRQFRVLVVLTLVSGFVGGAVSNLLLRGTPAQAQAGAPVQDVVKAKRFDLVDDAGKPRASLGVMPGGAQGLLLFDDGGKPRASLGVSPDGSPSLFLFDSATKGRLLLALTPDAEGSPGLWLYDLASTERTKKIALKADGTLAWRWRTPLALHGYCLASSAMAAPVWHLAMPPAGPGSGWASTLTATLGCGYMMPRIRRGHR